MLMYVYYRQLEGSEQRCIQHDGNPPLTMEMAQRACKSLQTLRLCLDCRKLTKRFLNKNQTQEQEYCIGNSVGHSSEVLALW